MQKQVPYLIFITLLFSSLLSYSQSAESDFTYNIEIYEIIRDGSELWDGNKIPNNQVVKGKKGDYFIIDIHESYYEDQTYFDAGEYIIDDFDTHFVQAINDFEKTLADLEIPPSAYDIFILGSADIAGQNTFRGRQSEIPEYQFYEVEFFQKCISPSMSKFESALSQQAIPHEFTNNHLPNLRAQFLKFKLEQTFSYLKSPIILDGSVKSDINAKDRNASIILFFAKNRKYPE